MFFGECLSINTNNKEVYFLSASTFHLRLAPLKHYKNNKGPEDFQSYTLKNNKIPSPKCFAKRVRRLHDLHACLAVD